MSDAVARLSQVEIPGPLPLPIGDLAPVVAGAIGALGRGDWWVPGLRERAGAVLRGVTEEELAHGSRPFKVAPASPSPALRAAYAVGLAKASGSPTLVHLGIGSVADGGFYEALNLAVLLAVPVLFVVAVHPLDGDAPVGRQLAADLNTLADSFGLETRTVGGTANEVHAAVSAAREAGGPQLVVVQLKGRT